MANYAFVVEGAHDASFLGQILKKKGFIRIKHLSAVPTEWRIMFPRAFPLDGETLERVMRFPEIFIRGSEVVSVHNAGSDSRLVSTARAVVEAVGVRLLKALVIFVDADAKVPCERFSEIRKNLGIMNDVAVAEGEPGFPLKLPTELGKLSSGSLGIAVFVFPDNNSDGALEHVLIACAQVNHPYIVNAAEKMLISLEAGCGEDSPITKPLRSGMGRAKAKVGTIANLLKPGVSVASSLAQTTWLNDQALSHPTVQATNTFVDAVLSS